MPLLAKLKHNLTIVELALQMGEEVSNIYPETQQWVSTPVIGRTRGEQKKIERAMDANSADFRERIYIDLIGVTP